MANNSLAPIAKWTIMHEQIVAMHIGGGGRISHEAIAKQFDLTPVRVSQILSDVQARRIINEAMQKVRSQMMTNLTDGLAVLADTALKQMAVTINFPDFVIGSDAKKHQDRLCLDLIKLVKGDVAQTEAVPPLNEEWSRRLIEALEDSNAADELIQEGQFEVVETKEDE